MKKIFFYLLKKYSKSERVEILSILDEDLYDFEKTPCVNVCVRFTEFIKSSKFIHQRIEENDLETLKDVKESLHRTYDETLNSIREKI